MTMQTFNFVKNVFAMVRLFELDSVCVCVGGGEGGVETPLICKVLLDNLVVCGIFCAIDQWLYSYKQ
jgi:hypothetical protein